MGQRTRTRKLALCVAAALLGGAVQTAAAADVTIDSTHPPVRNVPNVDDPSTPNSAASVGTGDVHASGSTLTVAGYQEGTLSVYGGLTRGTGDASDNTVRVSGAATALASIYGGAAWGAGGCRGMSSPSRAGY